MERLQEMDAKKRENALMQVKSLVDENGMVEVQDAATGKKRRVWAVDAAEMVASGTALPLGFENQGETEAAPEKKILLENMKLPELKALAETNGIDLGDATKKADIIACIREFTDDSVESADDLDSDDNE